jgi:hypothetical protein
MVQIIGDTTVSQPQEDAKRSLAVLAKLTGKSLPPSTLLGKNFVTIGNFAISQGSSYDVFRGEYFTSEEIAIKVLRHRVDEATAKQTHEVWSMSSNITALTHIMQRFARQAINWSSLRHNAILPFYGIGVVPSPIAPDEFQL